MLSEIIGSLMQSVHFFFEPDIMSFEVIEFIIFPDNLPLQLL